MLFSRFSFFILILGRPSWIFVEVSADYSFYVMHVYLKKTYTKIKRKIKKIKKTGQTLLKPE